MDATYLQQYLFIGLLAGVAVFLGAFPLIMSRLVSPKKPGQSKQSAYECGLESKGDAWIQARAPYYVYALLFVVFDVEVIFIYPWALIWKSLGPVALAEMALFIAVLAVALVFAWKKGVLEWD